MDKPKIIIKLTKIEKCAILQRSMKNKYQKEYDRKNREHINAHIWTIIPYMKSVERRFSEIQAKNPLHSSFICFVEAIKGQNFKKESLSKWFRRLVDKADYSRSDQGTILEQLAEL